jgi:hypothetical protein
MEIDPDAASVAGLDDQGTVLRGKVTQFNVRQQEGLPPIATPSRRS